MKDWNFDSIHLRAAPMPLVELRVSDMVCRVPKDARVLSYDFRESGEIVLSRLLISAVVVDASCVEMPWASTTEAIRTVKKNAFEKSRILNLLDLPEK